MNTSPNTPQRQGRRLAVYLAGYGFVVSAGIVVALFADFGARTSAARESIEVAVVPSSMLPSAVAPLVEAVFAQAGGTASLSGVVTFEGNPPKQQTLDTSSKDPEVCSAMPLLAEDLVVNPENKGIANVLVWLTKVPDGFKVPKPAEDPVVFDQKGCRFLPHCLVVQVGRKVVVKSDDPVPHNTHTFPVRSDAFNKVIGANDRSGTDLLYNKGERLPTEVKCDFHPWMKAYHLVLEHPYAAVTDADGKFTIPDLPPGKHEFIVWQEKSGYLNRKLEVELKAGEKKDVKMSFGAAKFAAAEGSRGATIAVNVAR